MSENVQLPYPEPSPFFQAASVNSLDSLTTIPSSTPQHVQAVMPEPVQVAHLRND